MLNEAVQTRIHSRVNILVDYAQPFAERLASAQLDKIDGRIGVKLFPLIGMNMIGTFKRIPRVALLRVNGPEDTDVRQISAEQGYRQTMLEELLAFAAAQYSVLASTSIIALDARCMIDGVEYVVACYYGGFVRSLSLVPVAGIKWNIGNQAVLVAEIED